MAERGPSLELEGIHKRFGPVRALDGATLTAHAGEVHALVGENGAGKSTLVGMLAGLLQPDAGDIRLDGRPVALTGPGVAAAHSIGIVHQHFKLVPALTALENVALGATGAFTWGKLPLGRIRTRALEVAATVGMSVDLEARVGDLSVGERQRIEILKLLYSEPRLLVLDEPTAVLSPREVAALFDTLRTLAREGRTVVLIAHKLDEVLAVADRVTVLRKGRTALEAPRGAVDAGVLTRAMVGGDPPRLRPRSAGRRGARVALLRDAGSDSGGRVRLSGVDLELYAGEIVAIAGVEGNGQRELALLLSGLTQPSAGEVELPAEPAYVPQERLNEGLIGGFDLTENLALGLHDAAAYRRGARLDWAALRARTRALLSEYDVRAPGPDARASTLSGGNQQKLVVGREMERGSDLFIAENPTRGLDVTAAAFVQERLLDLREQGRAVVLLSTDLDEILALGDRIFALVRGHLMPIPEDEHSREAVGARMLAGLP